MQFISSILGTFSFLPRLSGYYEQPILHPSQRFCLLTAIFAPLWRNISVIKKSLIEPLKFLIDNFFYKSIYTKNPHLKTVQLIILPLFSYSTVSISDSNATDYKNMLKQNHVVPIEL